MQTEKTQFGQEYMSAPTPEFRHRVNEWEYERGWGSRLEDVKYFKSKDDAVQYCKSYDDKYNTLSSAPDWYMKQEYVGMV